MLGKGREALLKYVEAYQAAASDQNDTYRFIWKNREEVAAEMMLRAAPLQALYTLAWDEYYAKKSGVKPQVKSLRGKPNGIIGGNWDDPSAPKLPYWPPG